jgi:hypothetical protein
LPLGAAYLPAPAGRPARSSPWGSLNLKRRPEFGVWPAALLGDRLQSQEHSAIGEVWPGHDFLDAVDRACRIEQDLHISNIAKRNIHYVLSDVSEGFITGFGMHSYILGLEAMLAILETQRQKARS